jgi:hypothetical protein
MIRNPLGNFIAHLTKEPTPFPILEFLDFLEIGKLAFKKIQIFVILYLVYLNLKKNFKYLLITFICAYSNLQVLHVNTPEVENPKLPLINFSFLDLKKFLFLNEWCSIVFNLLNLKLKQINFK